MDPVLNAANICTFTFFAPKYTEKATALVGDKMQELIH